MSEPIICRRSSERDPHRRQTGTGLAALTPEQQREVLRRMARHRRRVRQEMRRLGLWH